MVAIFDREQLPFSIWYAQLEQPIDHLYMQIVVFFEKRYVRHLPIAQAGATQLVGLESLRISQWTFPQHKISL